MTYLAGVAERNRANTPKGQAKASFSQLTFKELLDFVRNMLQHQLSNTNASSDQFLAECASISPHPLALFRDFILEALAPTSSIEVIHAAATGMLELFCSFPEWSFSHFSSPSNYAPLVHMMTRGRVESRRFIAKCLGLVSPHVAPEDRHLLLQGQLNILSAGRSALKRDEQVGAFLTLGACISRCIESSTSFDPFEKLSALFVEKAVKELQPWVSFEINYGEYAAEALGQIGRFAPLPVQSAVVEEVINGISKHVATAGVPADAVEVFVVALANLALGDRSLASNSALLDVFYSTSKLKQEEVHFTIGDALSCVGVGWSSTASADPLIPSTAPVAFRVDRSSKVDAVDNVEPILDKLMGSFILGDRADGRAAAAIWLLCILKSAGSASPAIKRQLKKIQAAFSHLLAESNEVVQEAAAKGIVLVYELGDSATQNSLIDTLVSTLQSGTKGFKMTEDAEILPGQAENAPAGSKAASAGTPQVSTYKELLSLASEMNQPDLVYRFMNLSTHHAVWNSKKGAAFATKSLAAKAQERLKPQLPELVPKLFRASYDPNSKIASSMTNILNALVPDAKELTSADSPYFSNIMRDLIENMFNKQWRTREASCLGLSDITASKTFAQVGPFLADLWERCFKVLDDVKETVRQAAEQLCKALSSLTLRLCDPSYTNIDDVRLLFVLALSC